MLFKTVFGSELLAIYSLISNQSSVTNKLVYRNFLPSNEANNYSTQNIDDALSFLRAAYMINDSNEKMRVTPSAFSFRLQVLSNIKKIAAYDLPAKYETDPLYFQILNEIFILPDKLFLLDYHKKANQLVCTLQKGGLSIEKMQAWRRVLISLGIGYQIGKGFQCVYTPDLIREIIYVWEEREGSLQKFVEKHVSKFIFFKTTKGSLPIALSEPLIYLFSLGEISLQHRQDSSSKPYFGDNKYRYIKVVD